ncbi:DUF6228 family protein [Streptomyces sp. NPDC006172]|uniref:DUF6228 family protein n=1 Tax=Streptomyces sp. NPDC006172 TaxID=3154470 RepID=UPI0033F8E820
MTSPDGHLDDKPSVTIRCQDTSSVGVTFCDRFSFDADSVHYAVELRAPGLTARVNEVVAWSWDSHDNPTQGRAAQREGSGVPVRPSSFWVCSSVRPPDCSLAEG